jgi:peptidoglycan/xylan/chitin deacetylase (PgdA/CDA1 family)
MSTVEKRSRLITKLTLSAFLYRVGILRYTRALRRRREIMFLMYHKTGEASDPIGLNVRPDILEQQIASLVRYTRFISLDQAVDRIKSKQIDRHYTVVTFDDGYHSNYRHAFPVLQKFCVPCTVFMSVGAVESGQLYWDVVNAAIMDERNPRLVLGASSNGERVFDLSDTAGRIRAIYKVHSILKGWRKDQIQRLVSELKQDYSMDPRHFDSVITWEDAASVDTDLVSLGSHGLSHVILTRLNPDEWATEIEESKRIIEERTGRSVSAFAYPNGEAADFNDLIIRRLDQAGYSSAATAIPGAVSAKGADLFRLPRIDVTERISLDSRGRFSRALFLCKVFRLL